MRGGKNWLTKRPSSANKFSKQFHRLKNFRLKMAQEKLSGNLELYGRDKRDSAILFAIQHGKSIDDANDLLDQLGVLPLGVPNE